MHIGGGAEKCVIRGELPFGFGHWMLLVAAVVFDVDTLVDFELPRLKKKITSETATTAASTTPPRRSRRVRLSVTPRRP
jgi:hypothetical protein